MAPELDPDIVKLLRKGQKIEAIKRLRARTNVGLAEAKALVDAFEQAKGQLQELRATAGAVRTHVQHEFGKAAPPTAPSVHAPPQIEGLGPGEVPAPRNQIVKLAAFLMLGAAAAWFLLR